MKTKDPVWDKSHIQCKSSFPFFKLGLSNACPSCCAKISMRIVYKALGLKKRIFSQMLSLNLNSDKFTAQLHLPQGRRKTSVMQLRVFLYDLPFRYLSYTKSRNVTIMTTQKIFLKVTCHILFKLDSYLCAF